jgi:hypothetical protein
MPAGSSCAGIVISAVVFTLLGLAAGVITRSQPVAVGAVFGLFVAERLLSVVIGDAGRRSCSSGVT